MDRREFLKSTSGVAALAGATTLAAAPSRAAAAVGPEAAAPAIVPGATRLRLGIAWPSVSGGPGESARRIGERVRLLSGGRLVLEAAGEPLGLNAIARGAADVVLGSAHDLMELDRAFAYFAGLPGDAGLGRHDTAAWLSVGGGQTLIDELGAAHGVKTLLAASSGQRGTLWSTRPITAAGDLAGCNVYAQGLVSDVARALGAEPVKARPDSLSGLLASGGLDAVQWGGPVSSYDARLPAAAKFGMMHGLARYGGFLALSFGAEAWERLPQAEQAMIGAAVLEEVHITTAEARTYDPVMREALEGVHGIRFSTPSAEFRNAVGRVTDAMVAHLSAATPRSGRINASYMAFRDAVRGRRGRDGAGQVPLA